MSEWREREHQTMVRTVVEVNGVSVFLAQDQDLDALKERFQDAARTSGTFVDLVEVGNRAVSVLVSSNTTVVISRSTVPFDPRDTGDDSSPFGDFHDF